MPLKDLHLCVLQQISTDKIRPEIESLVVDGIDSISRLAVVLLAEKKLGQVNANIFLLIPSPPNVTDV